MKNVRQVRKFVMAMLVSVFLIQGWFVYTDKTGRRSPALSKQSQHGHEIWQKQNCQTCHQLFGLGGFLGPDLTRVTGRFPPEAFSAVLRSSPPPMPDYTLSDADVNDLYSFLNQINKNASASPPQKTKNYFTFSEIPWFTTQ